MRVAVVFFSGRNRDGMMRLAQALARGIEKQGNQVDTFEGARDSNAKLTIYQYIVVGAEPMGTFGGKIPDTVKTFLAARYTHEERHVRRLGKVKALERRWSKEQP